MGGKTREVNWYGREEELSSWEEEPLLPLAAVKDVIFHFEIKQLFLTSKTLFKFQPVEQNRFVFSKQNILMGQKGWGGGGPHHL